MANPPSSDLRPAAALRDAVAEGYGWTRFRADLLAGLVVGVVALPLSMALAIATGVPPQHGLYTAIVAGSLIALLGGSRCQVSGPTAAFVVVLTPITAAFGLGGLAVASAMAGLLLMVMAFARLGRFITFVPYPVVTGFTAGIAVVIAMLQLKDLLGLTVTHLPEHSLERMAALVAALPTLRPAELGVGLLTLGVLIGWPKINRTLPGPLVALTVGALAAAGIGALWPDLAVDTIGRRFADQGGIPRQAPAFGMPWSLPGADGQPLGFSLSLLRDLAGPAFAIAMLGAIESLLSAVVADGLSGTRHDPNAELFAQGVGNVVAPFFGGFAATGALARTATNVRAGGKTPFAAVVHAVFVLAAMLALAPLLSWLPMASMAALLLIVAWNMSEARHVVHTLHSAPRSDVVVLLTCLTTTVVFDMVVAVVAGIMLASLLFMRRMIEVSSARLFSEDDPARLAGLPAGVVHYSIGGPLFFGAAHKALSELEVVGPRSWAVLLDLEGVPAIDATALVNLESAIKRLARTQTLLVLAGGQPQPAAALTRAGIPGSWGHVAVCGTLSEAVQLLRDCAPSGTLTSVAPAGSTTVPRT